MAVEALGEPILPEETIYFGDTAHDSACARDAGCDFALADWKGRGARDLQPRYVFADAEAMEKILIPAGD